MSPSCFAGGELSPTAASSATAVYWTRLGAVTLTWSRAALGLLLAADLQLSGDAVRFHLRPWLPWRRKGSKSFVAAGRLVYFAWDLSRARLAARCPEPAARYSLSVSVDGELALVAGDRAPSAGRLLSRREHAAVAVADSAAYTTAVTVGGEKHEVAVGIDRKAAAAEASMWVALDGAKLLQIRRLRWKFRGSETLDLSGAGAGRGLGLGRVAVSWDLHGWLFSPDAAAIFVLRFEADVEEATGKEVEETAMVVKQRSWKHHLGGRGGGESCSSSSTERKERKGRRRRGLFMSSSDSSMSVSSTGSTAGSVSTVTGWATAEEAALEGGDGFSLVIYIWRKKRMQRREKLSGHKTRRT